MDRPLHQNRDMIARYLGKCRRDLLWSLDGEQGTFRCDIIPGGELEPLREDQQAHDADDLRMLLARETRDFCLSLTRRDRERKSPLATERSLTYRGNGITMEIISLGTGDGGLAGITRDVTRQKRHENSLRKSEAAYRTLLKASPDAIIVIDAEGDIIKSNNRAALLLGETRDELIGRNFGDFIPPGKSLALDVVTAASPMESQELELRRADGSLFTGEVSITALEEEDLGQKTFIAVARDITKSKRAEREIMRSGERYRLLIETMNEGLLIMDKNQLFTYINRSASRVLGYTFEELLGKAPETVMDKKNSALFRRKLAQAKTREDREIRFEVTARSNTGEKVHIILSPKSIYGKDGDYLGAFTVVSDVTAIRKSEEERDRLADEIIGIFMKRLSLREKELLTYLSRGYRWPQQKRELCKKMNVLPGTLDKFLARIKGKLEIEDLDTIIAMAGAKLR